MAKKGCFAVTAAKLILGVSLKRPEVIKLMVFFTLYSAPQIKSFSNDDLNALANYCAGRIYGQHGNLHFIEFSKKEIIAKAKAEFRDRGGPGIQRKPAEWSITQCHFTAGEVAAYERILEEMLEEICASLKIPRVITLDDQTT